MPPTVLRSPVTPVVLKMPAGAVPVVPITPEEPPAKQHAIESWMGAELRRTGLSEAQVSMAVCFFREHGHKMSFPKAIQSLGLLTESEIAALIGKYWGYPVIDRARLIVEGDANKLIPISIARSRVALALVRTGPKTVRVAVADPSVANFNQIVHALAEKGVTPQFVIAPAADIIAKNDELNIPKVSVGSTDSEISNFVERIIEEAFKDQASDIHFIPLEHSLSVEFRIDGVVTPRYPISGNRKSLIINGVKICANKNKASDSATASSILDIGNRTIPQDASASRKFGSSRVNLRFSSIPTIYGESIVIRLLDQSKGLVPIDQLGMQPDMFASLLPVLNRGTGAILMMGPTGSGKTTSMYSMITATGWRARGLAFNSLENPVEYEMGNGAKQTEITDTMTWALGTRAILRQDPDIILVGEMRDKETASTVMSMSMTGHLLFSTIHTNHAREGFNRLIDLGVEPGNICSAISVFIAQRLVRKVCPQCRRPHPRNNDLCQQYIKELTAARVQRPQFYEAGAGCPACNGRGLQRQTGIFELLPVWPFANLIISKKSDATPSDFDAVVSAHNGLVEDVYQFRKTHGQAATIQKFGERQSQSAPIWSLLQDGMIKAGSGITTPEEVWGAI